MEILDISVFISFAFLVVAMLVTFVRLVKGPCLNDRIAAMDLIASIVMGFILLYSITIRKDMYVDIALVISLISFVGTVAISTYLNRKNV